MIKTNRSPNLFAVFWALLYPVLGWLQTTNLGFRPTWDLHAMGRLSETNLGFQNIWDQDEVYRGPKTGSIGALNPKL